MTTNAIATVQRYVAASHHYLENALSLLSQGEADKASELLWGSMAQAIQALATSRNIPLRNHRSLRWFVGSLTKELAEPELNKAFIIAERLHSNFHEVELDTQDVAWAMGPISDAVSRLLQLIPAEFASDSPHPETL